MTATHPLPLVGAPAEVALATSPRTAVARAVREDGATQELLAFEVDDAKMALPLGAVKEILKVAPITAVPRAPRAVLGILSVRGHITTIVSLRATLGLAPLDALPRSARILLVDRGVEVVGVLVDAVTEVLRLTPAEIEAADVVGAGLAEHVRGIGRPAGTSDVVVLLDPIALLRPLDATRRGG